MNSETVPPLHPTRLEGLTGHFAMTFTSTPRGARLARRLAEQRLDAWGVPYGSEAHDACTLIVAELTANAVQHGLVPGRGFRLTLSADACPDSYADPGSRTGPSDSAVVRVEVADTRTDGTPAVAAPDDECDGGRGLLLVAGLADRWSWRPRTEGPGKAVWAEYRLPERG